MKGKIKAYGLKRSQANVDGFFKILHTYSELAPESHEMVREVTRKIGEASLKSRMIQEKKCKQADYKIMITNVEKQLERLSARFNILAYAVVILLPVQLAYLQLHFEPNEHWRFFCFLILGYTVIRCIDIHNILKYERQFEKLIDKLISETGEDEYEASVKSPLWKTMKVSLGNVWLDIANIVVTIGGIGRIFLDNVNI